MKDYAKITTCSKVTNSNMALCKFEAVQNKLIFEL